MMLSNPGRLGLGDRIQTSSKALARTLTTMDKSVDKAEQDPARFHVGPDELIARYVHARQTPSALRSTRRALAACARARAWWL